MRTQLTKITLAAIITVAMAFTSSCAQDQSSKLIGTWILTWMKLNDKSIESKELNEGFSFASDGTFSGLKGLKGKYGASATKLILVPEEGGMDEQDYFISADGKTLMIYNKSSYVSISMGFRKKN
ncbi:MAG: hypothetical protein LBH25_01800 [Fibromonadaceae bacterium]|jgi:outer membrane lipoprotein-sorting protein|nr:hypothetical protein [Fibromonadaceae bacterium]